jgi:hypothetical protein
MRLKKLKKAAVYNSRTIVLSMCILIVLICSTQFLSAQRSDIVITKSGDRVAGEIKKLDRGRLEFKTSDMGTLNIEWDAIDSIESGDLYDIETYAGEHYLGSLAQADESGELKVQTDIGLVSVPLAEVVRIYPLGSNFWRRITGYLDAGLSYQSADKFVELTLGADGTYRSEKWVSSLALSTYLRTQKEGTKTRRNDLSYKLERIFKGRWSGNLFSTLEQNDELELDLRAMIGLGIGKYLIQNNRTLFHVFVGADVIQERRTGDASFATNFEALLGGKFEAFRYSTPKFDFNASLILFPNLTEFGRLRLYFDTRVRYEVLKDFFIGLTVFDKFDGDLREGGTRKNDFGINTTLSWSFK